MALRVGMLVALAAVPCAAQDGTPVVYRVLRGDREVARETVTREDVTVSGEFVPAAADPVRTRWQAVIAPEGTVALLEFTERQGLDTGRVRSRVVQRGRVIWRADSVAMESMTSGGIHMRTYGTVAGAAPYLNLSFGLLDVALRRVLPPAPGGEAELPLFALSGGRTATAQVRRTAPDSAVVRLGATEFRLALDAEGRISGGGIPAQEVRVERAS